ncbi:MAG: polyprenyl synthetase family protein [bacterium]|nr:polyprenyl synthetase family protein [bacterium]
MNDFQTFLAEIRTPIDAALDRLLPAASQSPERLHEALRYAVFAGGKRVRPALLVLTGEALGLEHEPLEAGGAALEMIHTYSLIHDDLPALDNDDLRRGRPTLHCRYDEATAILAGDALLTLGLTTLAVHPPTATTDQRSRSVALVGEAVGSRGMIGGQVDDLAAEAEWPEDAPAALEAIHRRKTGALLTASVRLAGIYAGSSAAEDEQLTALGAVLGLMFQIGDDILDVEGTSGTLGKTAGKDATARKLTYPGLYGLEESKRLLAQTRDEALALAAGFPRRGTNGGLPAAKGPAGEVSRCGGLFHSLIDYLSTRDH